MQRIGSGVALLNELCGSGGFEFDDLRNSTDSLHSSMGMPRPSDDGWPDDDEVQLPSVDVAGVLFAEVASATLSTECAICQSDFCEQLPRFDADCHNVCVTCMHHYVRTQIESGRKLFHRVSWLEQLDYGLALRIDDVVGVKCPCYLCPEVIHGPLFDRIVAATGLADQFNEQVAFQRKVELEFRLRSHNEFVERRFQVYIGSNPAFVRRCPKCDTLIEKNGGCTHMFCSRCQTDFDWTQARQLPRLRDPRKQQ